MPIDPLFIKKDNEIPRQIGIKAKYIKTMEFAFNDVIILNCNTEDEVAERIKENDDVV